jgi:chitinase
LHQQKAKTEKMKMTRILILSLLALICTSCSSGKLTEEYMVVAYVSGYRNFDFTKIDAAKLTHINYAFANIIDDEVRFGSEAIDNTEMNADDIRAITALKKVNPDLKVLVSVGGWGWSGDRKSVV